MPPKVEHNEKSAAKPTVPVKRSDTTTTAKNENTSTKDSNKAVARIEGGPSAFLSVEPQRLPCTSTTREVMAMPTPTHTLQFIVNTAHKRPPCSSDPPSYSVTTNKSDSRQARASTGILEVNSSASKCLTAVYALHQSRPEPAPPPHPWYTKSNCPPTS